MQEVAEIATVRELVREQRCHDRSIGLVPTLGYLHEGHLALVDRARAENNVVIMSIFVNPTQFGPGEDLERYPRDLGRDRRLAEDRGVDVLFTPDVAEMYPDGVEDQLVWVDPGSLSHPMEGASRPTHFRGVATVVLKLFNAAQPDRAYFGQKDAQQAAIVRQMVRDLAVPVDVRIVPTVRERDGLALSSRNVYLSPEERRQAAALSGALSLARDMVAAGERDPGNIVRAVRAHIEERAPLARVDYVAVADPVSMQPLQQPISSEALVALAAFFGSTRLIDNIVVGRDGDALCA